MMKSGSSATQRMQICGKNSLWVSLDSPDLHAF